MAKLPLRISGQARPQIGGPQSRASVSGLGALGKGLSDIGVSMRKKQTDDENLNVDRDALKIQERSLLNEDAVLTSSENSEQVDEGITTFQKDVLNEFTQGKSRQYREKLENATLKMFFKSRMKGHAGGKKIDINRMMDDVNIDIDAAERIARQFPDFGAGRDLINRITTQIGDSVGLTDNQKRDILKEVDERISVAELKGRMDTGIMGAMEVREVLKTTKFNGRISTDKIESLQAEAQALVMQGQREVLATADTELNVQLAMERGGRDTGLTPEKMEAQLQGFGLPQHEIDRRVIKVKRNKFYGQEVRMSAQGPQFNLEARKRQVQDVVDNLSQEDIASANNFAIESMAQLDALNDLETQKREDPHGYALEWIPTLRNQDTRINTLNAQMRASDDDTTRERLRMELLAERTKYAANLQEQSTLLFGAPDSIPLVGKKQRDFFITNLGAATSETQAQMVLEQIKGYGPAAAGQVMKTFFNERDQQAWQYIAPILENNNRGAVFAIDAHANWQENKKLTTAEDITSVKEGVAVSMSEFNETFQVNAGGTTMQSGNTLAVEIAVDQMRRGVEEGEAIESAIQIVTGNWDVIDTTRVSKKVMSKFPSAQNSIQAVRSGRFNAALSASAAFDQFPGDQGNQEFNKTPLSAFTSPNGDGIVVYAGKGVTASPVLDHNGNPRVITWEQLNVIGTRMPKNVNVLGQNIGFAKAPRKRARGEKGPTADSAFAEWLSGYIKETQLPLITDEVPK